MHAMGQVEEINNSVINLSKRPLNAEEFNLLAKGLNFCPSRHFNLFETILDVNKFSRTLTLRKHFFNCSSEEMENSLDNCDTGESLPSPKLFSEVYALQDLIDLADESDQSPLDPTDTHNDISFKSRSDLYPVASRGKDIDLFQKMVEGDLVRLARSCNNKKLSHDNLTVKERQAFKDLSADDSIVIRNADKGGMVIVLDSETYKEEALRQLSDTYTYQPLASNPTIPFKKELTALLDRAVQAGIFTPKDKESFIPEHPIMPVFHHLPKVHKGVKSPYRTTNCSWYRLT